MSLITDPARTGSSAVSDCSAALIASHFSFLDGAELVSALGLTDDDVQRFANYWDGLTLDRYMGDNGRYRFRRYSALSIADPKAPIELLPHGPYQQSSDVNPLNGGVQRFFDPAEPGFLSSALLQRFLRFLTETYNLVEGRQAPWVVRLHPYRIRADIEDVGKPAPEGMHQDGVDFVLTLMIKRCNVSGGESSIATLDREVVWRNTLSNPLDLLVCNDRAVMHGVTNVHRVDTATPAWRDVLVVAFSRH